METKIYGENKYNKKSNINDNTYPMNINVTMKQK